MYDAESEFRNSHFVFNAPNAARFLGLVQWTYSTKLDECYIEINAGKSNEAWGVAEKLDKKSEIVRTIILIKAPSAEGGLSSSSAVLYLIESRVFLTVGTPK